MDRKLEIQQLNPKPIEIVANHFEITLRQFSVDDASHIFGLINRNRKHLSQFGETTANKYETLSSVEDSIVSSPNRDRLRFGIWNSNKEFVGSINLTPEKDRPRKGEIGYYLGAEYSGHGYMLKALLTLSTYAFYNRGYEQVNLSIREDNTPSLGVAKKAGFKKTGTEDKNGKVYQILTLYKPK